LQLDPHGTPIWDQATADSVVVAVDGEGNVVAVGTSWTADAGTYTSVMSSYDLAGNSRYAMSWTSTTDDDTYSAGIAGIAVSADGSIGLVGGVGSYSTFNFGVGALPDEADAGYPYGPASDGFVVRFH
jgi:hypothetical protein